MKKLTAVVILLGFLICLGMASSQAEEKASKVTTEYLLEKPAWGLIEWNSATLPQGFWYPSFELVYLNNNTYFDHGKEKDYTGGRDSANYILYGKLLYGLTNKITFGVDIPVVASQKVDSGGLYLEPKKIKTGATSVGDIRLFLKYHIFDKYFWSVAAEAGPTLPTGKPYNQASAKQSGTGDGQTDLNLAIKGDILINEESFIKLNLAFTHQFPRNYRDMEGLLIKEKLGDYLETQAGYIKNLRTIGLGGALEYYRWQATKWNDKVHLDPSELYNVSLYFTIGDAQPQKQGKFAFFLDFPLTGNNVAATYRLGVSLRSIFK